MHTNSHSAHTHTWHITRVKNCLTWRQRDGCCFMCVLKRCGFVLYFIFLPHHAEPTLPAAVLLCSYFLCARLRCCWCGTFPLAVISLASSASCINFCVKCPRRTALARLSTPIYIQGRSRVHTHNAPPARGWITKLQSSHAAHRQDAHPGAANAPRALSASPSALCECALFICALS